MLKTLAKIVLAAAATMAAPQMASADIIEFDVSSYNQGSSCAHGLYVGSIRNNCQRRFDLQDGSLFAIDTAQQTATFTGSAINSKGTVANIDLNFTDFLETTAGSGLAFKNGSGVGYNPATDTPDIDFFSGGFGTIDIGGTVFTLNQADPFRGNTLFQFGTGANDKTLDFGGSAWINLLDPYGRSLGYVDINFNLARRPGTPVPAPAGLGLMALGLAALGFGLRRRKQASIG